MAKSKAWKLNSEDTKKWVKNMSIFLIPLVIVYLNSIISRLNAGESSVELLKLTPETMGALLLYILNALTDLLKKLSAGK